MKRRLVINGMAVALAAPSTAISGVYEVPACGPSVGDVGAWQASSSAPSTLEAVASCPPANLASGLTARDRTGNLNTPQGARAEWIFTAPTGTRVVGIRARRWMATIGDDGWRAYLRDGSGRDLEHCATGPGSATCFVALGGTPRGPEAGPVTFDGLDTDRVALGVRCEIPQGQLGTSCVNGLTASDATYTAQEVVVRVSDPTPPALVAAEGALRSAEGRWVSGTMTLQVSGTDAQSGVARVGVLTGADVAATAPGACTLGRAAPCPPAFTGLVSVDTRTRPDGQTQLRAFSEDAGGERGLSVPWTVGIDNTPPNQGVVTDRAPVRAGEPFALTWGRDAGAPFVRADWQLVPVSGSARTIEGVAVGADLRKIPVTVPVSGPYRIRLTFSDAAGNTGAMIETSLSVERPRLAIASNEARAVVRNGRIIALIGVPRASKARRYIVHVTRPGARARRFHRVVRPGASRLIVPLGPPTRMRQTVTLKWRRIGASASRTMRIRLPARTVPSAPRRTQ
jgi:hypothetical protein